MILTNIGLAAYRLGCGARGYLLKETVTDEIHTCMHEINLGNLYVSINLSEKNDQFDFDFPEYETLTRMEKKYSISYNKV